MRLRALVILGMAIGLPAALAAQAMSGQIYGSVHDEHGENLPGVTVTLSGCGAPQSTTSGGKGEFHFLNLAPCVYAVRTELPGLTTVERNNVVVNVGTNTELAIEMKVASVATTITVTSESPLLDTRKQSSGATFNNQELKSIPTARDPWVMLQQTPGVLLDRQNVGGSESGQQSGYTGKGTDPSQNAWNVDGVSVTDMSALGATSTYFDFDAFEEMQMTTGGTDPSITVPGVTINMVTRRGTNEVHGSARFYDTPSELQARPTTVFGGAPSNTIDHIDDYGVEAGGPLWPDKAWLWGSYGKNQINKLVAGVSDKTTLENFSGKLNIQPIESNTFTLFFFRGDKLKFGRGAAPDRPQPTTLDQKGPTTIWKGEDSQVFSPQFVADANWSWEGGGFSLTPEGGVGKDVYQDQNEVWQNSYGLYDASTPEHQVNANLSSFFNTGTLGHELKFGFGYRKFGISSVSTWPGQGNISYENYGGQGFGVAKLTRNKVLNMEGKYLDFFIGDTITANNLTVNLGLRYDDQQSRNLPSKVTANAVFPDLLPAIDYPGGGDDLHFKDWQPRIGLTYALGAQKTTLLRASYSRFADQLGAGYAQFENPIGYQYLYYYWTDANANHRVDPGELGDFYGAYGVDPNNPASVASSNSFSRHLKNQKTDEFLVGVDHQILPEFVAGLSYTYRHRFDFVWYRYTQLTSANLVPASAGLPGVDQHGNPVGTTGPIYACVLDGVGCGRNPDFTFGKTGENRPDYSVNYHSVELVLTKRLSHRWMAHGAFTWNSWKQKVGNKEKACIDPTNVIGAGGDSCDSSIAYVGGTTGSGSFSNVFINARWAFNIAALYQLPWNFNVGANFYGREGYPAPYFVSAPAIVPGTDQSDGLGSRKAVVGAPDSHRNPSLFQLDLRLEKVIPLFQKADLTLSLDLFNSFNSKTVLQQRLNATPSDSGTGEAGQVYEVQNPRILRFGARLSF
jgi:hypothetical protein